MADVTKHRKLAVWVPWGTVGALVVVFWVLFLLKRFAGLDLIGDKVIKSKDAGFEFYAALGLTVVGPIVGWIWMKRGLYLLEHGVVVQGRVKNKGLFGTGVGTEGASIPVTFVYEVEGKEYTTRKDVPKVIALQYTEETRVEIYVDPKKPGRCMVIE
jgi:hypothetical protein